MFRRSTVVALAAAALALVGAPAASAAQPGGSPSTSATCLFVWSPVGYHWICRGAV